MAKPSETSSDIGARLRASLVERTATELDGLLSVVGQKLSDLMDEAVPATKMQVRQDAWFAYRSARPQWRTRTLQLWQEALQGAGSAKEPVARDQLELIETDTIENKILASRMALALMEEAAAEVNDLRKRCKALQYGAELAEGDVVHPEALILPILEGWSASGIGPDAWPLVAETVTRFLVQKLPAVYAACNQDLQAQGVMPLADPGLRVRTSTQMSEPVGKAAQLEQPTPQTAPAPAGAEGAHAPAALPAGVFPGRFQRAQGLLQQMGQLVFGGRAPTGLPRAAAAPSTAQPEAMVSGWSTSVEVGEPAQATAFFSPPSATLLAATYQPVAGLELPAQAAAGEGGVVVSPQWVQQIADDLQKISAQVKQQASTDSEKAMVELVSLMFQAILQEDRLPASIRVWFARLQMPVLRLALESPSFFHEVQHPARKLIDHMGSCVMGFDGSIIDSAALEAEIKRIVQVVEQYPDSGDRVYVKVYDEFQAFLKQHLTGRPDAQKVLGVAEKLELKETLAIQYTIEFRNQLQDMPVREDIREFLFKTWAEVLAVATVRDGAQHDHTRALKKTAFDLIWAASAKPSRAERARVISTLPALLKSLRTGMGLLGTGEEQLEAQLQLINSALADAFMSREQGIDEAQIRALSKRLENLEAVVSEDGLDELQLDAQTIEQLLGVDVTGLHVVNEGGGSATVAMLKWVAQVGLGSWFKLEHHGQSVEVQYAWRSPLGHLHLFASAVGESYLMQTRRMAAYLEAGLMQPQENETLTTRATRDAMARLQAQPDLLLS
jgi:hypothetical protein